MKRQIAEWLWRMALLVALGWIGWELRLLHEDMKPPIDEPSTTASAPDETLDALDAIRDDLEGLTQKVNAILVVMARTK